MTAAADVRALLEQIQGHRRGRSSGARRHPRRAWSAARRTRSSRSSTSRSRRARRSPAAVPTGWSPCPSGRSPSAASTAIDDGTPLIVVDIEAEHEVAVDDLLAALPDVPVEFADRGGFATGDDDYGDVVEAIIRDEIGQGEGANLVIGRHYRAVVADWDADRALTVFRRLLERERGAYWTFCFFTGERFLIGASPERHVSVHGRRRPDEPDLRHVPRRPAPVPTGSAAERAVLIDRQREVKERLLEFLADEKEVFELFMVVDEELKMMCDICHEGGQVLGPFLKPMTHLIHTEYLLAGRSDRDHREILRDTMYAATVTGAPVENACRLIADYEPEGRGYYGAALALFGRSPDGTPTMDSPILIRTADVSPEGRAQGDGRRHAGARLARGLRGGRDAGQGRRHPQRLRPGPGRDLRRHRHRRAGARRGRAARARHAQPAAVPLLADRPGRRARRPGAGRARRW